MKKLLIFVFSIVLLGSCEFLLSEGVESNINKENFNQNEKINSKDKLIGSWDIYEDEHKIVGSITFYNDFHFRVFVDEEEYGKWRVTPDHVYKGEFTDLLCLFEKDKDEECFPIIWSSDYNKCILWEKEKYFQLKRK